jgi:hypothetical protein
MDFSYNVGVSISHNLIRLQGPLFISESGSAENRIRNPWICSQELWPLHYIGDNNNNNNNKSNGLCFATEIPSEKFRNLEEEHGKAPMKKAQV